MLLRQMAISSKYRKSSRSSRLRMPAHCEILNTMQSVIVSARFCGPPDSGNGGYTCGLVANEVGGVVECTLRSPVPLETSLDIERSASGGVVRHGNKVIVEISSTTIDVALPAPID